MLINHGAVRSGKTTIDNDIFLQEILRISEYAARKGIKEPQYIIGGASVKNINRNIIRELNQKYGLEIKLNQANEFTLFGVVCCCLGTDDLGRFSGAVGMTSYGLYLNEGSTAKQEVFDELLKRCSGDTEFTPMIIIDSNPDSPEHYLYRNYISLPIEERKRIGILTYHWELDDNPFLNPQVRENIKNSTPSGVFYDRKIKGLWITAEGIVYEDFYEPVHVVDDSEVPPKNKFERFFCGVDWGYEHKGVISLWGVTSDGTRWLLKLVVAQHKLIDWWVAQARLIIEEYGYGFKWYCDDARPDNIDEFVKARIWAVGADKRIASGVECVAGYMKTQKIKIPKKYARLFCGELFKYVWDPKTGLPVKEDDDIMDSTRYGIFSDSEDNK
ncbi:MAG: PBSX family phage terminase large subunit [Candidatus Coproplasma sp.]